MGVTEIVIVVVCSLFVIGVITASIINKKKGKTSCGCGCTDCSACKSNCKTKNK